MFNRSAPRLFFKQKLQGDFCGLAQQSKLGSFAFGGQRSIQLSYGCVGVHLADWRGVGNGPTWADWAGSKARKAKVTRSNRVGCARKACAGRAGIVAAQFP